MESSSQRPKKVELKVTANREDVQLGLDVDSKLTGLAGEWTLTLSKVYSRFEDVRQAHIKGNDKRLQIIAKLQDRMRSAIRSSVTQRATAGSMTCPPSLMSAARWQKWRYRAGLRRPTSSIWIGSNKEEQYGRQAHQDRFRGVGRQGHPTPRG